MIPGNRLSLWGKREKGQIGTRTGLKRTADGIIAGGCGGGAAGDWVACASRIFVCSSVPASCVVG
jgi:hypothetical protein